MSRTHLANHPTITGLAVPLAQYPDLSVDTAANTAARHASVTLAGGSSAALSLAGQVLSLDESQLSPTIPEATQAELDDASNALNTTDKTKGKRVFVTDIDGGRSLEAGGTAANSPWRAGGIDTITPS